MFKKIKGVKGQYTYNIQIPSFIETVNWSPLIFVKWTSGNSILKNCLMMTGPI